VIIGRVEARPTATWGEVAYVFDPAVGFRLCHRGHPLAVDFCTVGGTADLWAAVHPLNVRSIRLLERLGFEEQPVPPTRPLGSYDEGDVVFLLDAGLSTHGTVSVRL
jgi:L-amino acid N-acyltransferase YncA